MLEAALGVIPELISRLIALVKERREMNRRLFEDHIEPINKDMQIVYDDYVEMFTVTRDQLRDTGVPLKKIIKELRERRRKYARVRGDVRKYAAKLVDTEAQQKIMDFADACLAFLKAMVWTPPPLNGIKVPNW